MAGFSEFPNLDPSITGAPRHLQADAKKTIEAATSRKPLKLFDGPLAVLDTPLVGANILTYPQDLGTNSQYRYLMRILVFRQRRDVKAESIISPNAFDIGLRASQQGRINTNIVNGATVGVGLVAAAASVAGDAATALGKRLLGIKIDAALSAVTGVGATGAAGAVAFDLDQDGNLKQGVEAITEPLAYINLYMPDGLNFVDRLDYDAVSVTDALGVAGLVGTGTGTEIAARTAEGATIGGTRLLGENITDLTLYSQGYALNPQLQVLFKGGKNREFVFTFKFVPRNSTEAATVDSIIRTLRYHAAPNYQQEEIVGDINAVNNSRYFIPPSQFEIEFWIADQTNFTPNTKLPRIAQCVLTNVDVNFAPSGQFSAYVDGYPVETQVQLTFTETIVLTKPDIAAGY